MRKCPCGTKNRCFGGMRVSRENSFFKGDCGYKSLGVGPF